MKSLLRMVSAALLLGLAGMAQAQVDLIHRFVLEDQNAVAVLPPELVAAPTIKKVFYAPDGLSLIVLREKMKFTPDLLPDGTGKTPQKLPDGEQELIYWSSRTRIARSIWQGDLYRNSVYEVAWLPQTETAFVLLQTNPPPIPDPNAPPFKTEWSLLRMAEGQARPTELAIPDPGQEGGISLSASNTLPLVWIEITQVEAQQKRPDGTHVLHYLFYLLRREGRLEKPVPLPGQDELFAVWTTWDKDGNPALTVREAKDKTRKYYAVNPQTFATTLLEGKFEGQRYEEPNRTKAGLLSLKRESLTTDVGENKKLLPVLWLESSVKSEFPRMLLSGDATEGVLRPKADGAFYQAQGALWFAPFVRLNQARFLAARRESLRVLAMSNAKQAGLGLMMYVQDYDEEFPTGEGIHDKIYPYIKNDSVLEGFNYTYKGGKLSDIDKPAETLIGYVGGPGGRANIFADGHVKWKDDDKGAK